MHKKLINYCLITCLGLFTQCSHEPSIKDLAWLKGNWANTAGEAALFENWTINSDGSLSGYSYALENAETTFSERVTLSFVNDGIYYQVRVGGSEATYFKLMYIKENEALFENPDLDFPQRIIYKLVTKDSLYARIEGLIDGKLQQEEFGYQRTL